MRPFGARRELPGRVRTAVTGRALSGAEVDDGSWLVGTRDALHVVDGEGGPGLVLPWEQVQRADWDAETSTLQIDPVADYGAVVPRRAFVLPDPGSLLPLVRERVSASVVVQRRVELGRRRGLTVIARRSPSGRGAISWAYELDEGVDPAEPAVRAAAESALRDAQESLGL